MSFRIGTKCLILTMIAGFLTACNQWEEHVAINDPMLGKSVMDLLREHPDYSKFVRALEVTGYDSLLSTAQAFTVFAPVDTAWAKAGIDPTVPSIDSITLIQLTGYIKNHIAFQSYPLTKGVFTTDKIRMLNGKLLVTSGNKIDSIELSESNLLTGNGVIHSVASLLVPKMNIWEYINQDIFEDSEQVQFLKAQESRVADLDNSWIVRLDSEGRPIYDTIWVMSNPWLDKYGLNDEDSTYTFLLISSASFQKLQEKYAPYFTIQKYQANGDGVLELVTNNEATAEQVKAEIVSDMILLPVKVTSGVAVYSTGGVKVQIPVDPDATYEASNGIVYEMFDVDVKMYQNKIPEIIVEGEAYAYSNVASTIISKRMKNWASSGYDIVLSGRDPISGLFALSSQSTTFYTNVINSYLAYNPVLNSVPYRVYWKSYDDLTGHVSVSMPYAQKLFFSNPQANSLSWSSSGEISNNFLDTVIFVGRDTAGIQKETKLWMWSTTGTTLKVAKNRLTELVDYEVDQLPCTGYGAASLRVSNCAFSATGAYGGSIFLDYIRLVPVVNPSE
jgi:uncharacterized surface protein with fasciclin (FAS1) repeats